MFRREKREFLSREVEEKWERNRVEAIYKNMNLDGSRRCRELSRTNSRQINLSRCCQASVDDKRTLMDRATIKKLSSKQKSSLRSIETNSRKLWWIKNVIRSVEKSSLRVSIDSYLSRSVEKMSRWAKTIFQRREKHINECNHTCYPTKDPNNILNFKIISQQEKMSSI